MKHAPILVIALAAAGCSSGPRSGPEAAPAADAAGQAETLAVRVENAHGLSAWRRKEAVAGDLAITFGGKPMLEAAMFYDPHDNLVRMELSGGEILVFDGSRAWVSPSSAEVPMARFHVLTWTYFLAAPFKLRDPGTNLEPWGRHELFGEKVETARLRFGPGVGDSPDDWYVLYEDPETHRLAAMAYIVTYGDTSVAEAEKEPHAIVYHDYRVIDGVALATRWSFHHWSAEEGPHGDIGVATVRNLRFVEPDELVFAKPLDAREDPL